MDNSRIESRHLLVAMTLVIFTIAMGAWMMVPGVSGSYHDDGIYVCTAKALAEGQGYRLINLPGAPLQTKYPIIYPALLAAVWKIFPSFPENILMMQWLTLMLGAVAVGLVYLYLIRFAYFEAGVTLAACLLTITSSSFLYFNIITMTEPIFLLLMVSSMWMLENELYKPCNNPLKEVLLGFSLALPFLCRTIGVVFILIGLLLLYRYKRRLRYVFSALTLACIPWILWVIIVPKWESDVVTIYYTNYIHWWSDLSIGSIFRIFSANIFYLLLSAGSLYQSFITKFLEIFNIYSWPILISFGFITLFALGSHVRSFRVLPCLLIGYLLIVLLWPWPPQRFIMPLLPFLLAYFIKELWQSPPYRISRSHWNWILQAGLTVFLIVNLSFSYIAGKTWQGTSYPDLVQSQEPVHWSSYQEVFQWIKTNTKTSDVLCSGFDSMIYLYTGRTAFRPYMIRPASLFYFENSAPLGEQEDFKRTIKLYRPRYLIKTAMPGYSEEKPLDELIENVRKSNPGWLNPVFVGKDNRFVIYEFQYSPENSGQYL